MAPYRFSYHAPRNEAPATGPWRLTHKIKARRFLPLVIILSFGAAVISCGGNSSGGGTPPPPPPPPTYIGIPDQQFNQLFTQNGPGWTGGDSTYSLPLPDGRVLWMFSDSYFGTVDSTTRTRATYLFNAHNSLVTTSASGQDFTTLYPPGASAEEAASYFVPAVSSNWFWVGAGLVQTAQNQLQMFLLEWEAGPTPGSFQFVGNTVVNLSLPDLTVISYQPLNTPTTIEWGSSVLLDGDWLYIYGIEDLGAVKYPHVARTTPDQIANPSAWTHWNGVDWVSDEASSARLLTDSISNEYSISKINGSYLLVAMDTSPAYGTWKNIVTYSSTSPTGPWGKRTVVYSTPETGQGNLVTYNPRAHPEFTANDQLLISYNVNSLVPQDLVHADDYRPKFIRVPLAGLL
ncbi:MAG: DUF5005 domain-containing protein [Acidobacteriia bacterium]|nr:DUF5005 domain-containing protein [Terriglobia bacterium]